MTGIGHRTEGSSCQHSSVNDYYGQVGSTGVQLKNNLLSVCELV